MTLKTEQFKSNQKPRWTNGKPANGDNFAQFIDAIAQLVEDTATETYTGVRSSLNIPNDAKIKELAKAVLNTEADFSGTALARKITEAAGRQFNYDTDAKTKVASDITERLKTTASYFYTWKNNQLTVTQNGAGAAVTLTAGANFLTDTGTGKYSATPITEDKTVFELTRPDGGRLIYNVSSKTVTVAANLIG